MTGRRLYEHYCDAAVKERALYQSTREASVLAHDGRPPLAWPFLSQRDRRVWNDLARRVTPKRKARRADR